MVIIAGDEILQATLDVPTFTVYLIIDFYIYKK